MYLVMTGTMESHREEKRPRRMDYAWATIETNEFGIDEFCQWAEKVGIEPMIAVNLGTGSIKDAGDLVNTVIIREEPIGVI